MLYAALKSIHLLAVIAWIGGMFFTLACLGAARQRLIGALLGRFFAIVNAATGVLLVSGLWMLWLAYRAAAKPGLAFNMPLDWYLMIALGVLMFGIFGHIRAVAFKRLQQAVQAQDAPAGAAALVQIRRWVGVNLALGVVVVVVMKLGAT